MGPARPTQPPPTTPPPADDDGPSEPMPDTPTADTPAAQPGCGGIGLDVGVGDLLDLDVCLLG